MYTNSWIVKHLLKIIGILLLIVKSAENLNRTNIQIIRKNKSILMFSINCNKLQILEKSSFWKKFFMLICARKIFKTVCWNLFKINGSLDILGFSDFMALKFVIHNRINNKNLTKKDQESSTHCSWDNYLRKLSSEVSPRKDKIVVCWNF